MLTEPANQTQMRVAADHKRAMTRRIPFTRTTLDKISVSPGKDRMCVEQAKMDPKKKSKSK